VNSFDVIVIGGGQSGLAVGYYLKRSGLTYVILDSGPASGGAWLHGWESLRLFSPAYWSSLPGSIMPGGSDYYPGRTEVVEYLTKYEKRNALPVRRPVEVLTVARVDDGFVLATTEGPYRAKAVVSATGSFLNPFIPEYPGRDVFRGEIIHSSDYHGPDSLAGQTVAVVGEGNSGAQLLAEISLVAHTIWITRRPPRFLPDHIDGRYLFDAATKMYEAKLAGKAYEPPSLSDIVMVPSVKEARSRNVLQSFPPFHHYTEHGLAWENGDEKLVDTVIFCTGFKPVLNHLPTAVFDADGKPSTVETRSMNVDGLWLVGYGNWTGFASATLIGVGRSARKTVEEVKQYLIKLGTHHETSSIYHEHD